MANKIHLAISYTGTGAQVQERVTAHTTNDVAVLRTTHAPRGHTPTVKQVALHGVPVPGAPVFVTIVHSFEHTTYAAYATLAAAQRRVANGVQPGLPAMHWVQQGNTWEFTTVRPSAFYPGQCTVRQAVLWE